MDVKGPPHGIFKRNALLGWSLTPDSTVTVPFRKNVVQNVGPNGWRIVPNLGQSGLRVNLYGCSWTYGTGLSDEETLAARLQVAFPEARIRNRGCGGHGTVHNYVQFRQDIAARDVDIAVFLVISDHRFRNTPHPHRFRHFQSARWARHGVTRTPVVKQDRDGEFRVGYISLTQPAVEAEGLETFLPTDYMLDQATFAALRAAQSVARSNDIPLQVAVLDQVDPEFNSRLVEEVSGALDISVPFDAEHFLLPHNTHPNAHANSLFFERLQPAVRAALDPA